MNSKPHPENVGSFLMARRAELSPSAVGLPESGMRRVRGLRREEVAQLAAISTDYYTRLEQGRVPASRLVLDTLARVLRLDDDQRTYLYEIAGKGGIRPHRSSPQKVRPQMQRLLDHLTDVPPMVQGRHFDILAWNPLAAALMVDFSQLPPKQRNYAWLVFMNCGMRQLYPDWENVARLVVALLRMEAAKDPEDARLTALVGELSMQSPEFRAWWAAQSVASKGRGIRRFTHPVVGTLDLEWDTLTSESDPEQELIVWTAEEGSSSYEALQRLKEVSKSLPSSSHGVI